MTDETRLSAARWQRAHSTPHLKSGNSRLHDPEKARALRALSEPEGAVFSGAVVAGPELDAARAANDRAREVLDAEGNDSPAFAEALLAAPATALASLTQDARTTAGFEPALEPPSTDEFNAFTSAIGTNPLLFVTTAIQLHGSSAIYRTEEDALEGTVELLPIPMPDAQQAQLSGLIAEVATLARDEGSAPERPFAIFLFRITAAQDPGFTVTGSNWKISATYEAPRFSREKVLEIRVTLENGLNAVLKWKSAQWKSEHDQIARQTDTLPSFEDWAAGFGTPDMQRH